MKLIKQNRGEIATVLTLISMALMVAGAAAGSFLAQEGTRFQPKAATPTQCIDVAKQSQPCVGPAATYGEECDRTKFPCKAKEMRRKCGSKDNDSCQYLCTNKNQQEVSCQLENEDICRHDIPGCQIQIGKKPDQSSQPPGQPNPPKPPNQGAFHLGADIYANKKADGVEFAFHVKFYSDGCDGDITLSRSDLGFIAGPNGWHRGQGPWVYSPAYAKSVSVAQGGNTSVTYIGTVDNCPTSPTTLRDSLTCTLSVDKDGIPDVKGPGCDWKNQADFPKPPAPPAEGKPKPPAEGKPIGRCEAAGGFCEPGGCLAIEQIIPTIDCTKEGYLAGTQCCKKPSPTKKSCQEAGGYCEPPQGVCSAGIAPNGDCGLDGLPEFQCCKKTSSSPKEGPKTCKDTKKTDQPCPDVYEQKDCLPPVNKGEKEVGKIKPGIDCIVHRSCGDSLGDWCKYECYDKNDSTKRVPCWPGQSVAPPEAKEKPEKPAAGTGTCDEKIKTACRLVSPVVMSICVIPGMINSTPCLGTIALCITCGFTQGPSLSLFSSSNQAFEVTRNWWSEGKVGPLQVSSFISQLSRTPGTQVQLVPCDYTQSQCGFNI